MAPIVPVLGVYIYIYMGSAVWAKCFSPRGKGTKPLAAPTASLRLQKPFGAAA